MKIVNLALTERTVDDDFTIFGTDDKNTTRGFTLSEEMLRFLHDRIHEKLKNREGKVGKL
jgi:hypothetical protein